MNRDFTVFGNLTLSDQSANAYRKRALSLCRRVLAENPHIHAHDYRAVVGWLIALRPTVSINTFQQYKSALVYWLWHENAADAVAREAAAFLIRQSSIGAKKKGEKTSALKQKFINSKQLEKILRELDAQNGVWAARTTLFLLSGILCGLRIVEWETARLVQEDGKWLLRVQNGKASNGRSNGMVRHIDLSQAGAENLATVQAHLANIADFLAQGRDFKVYYQQCARILLAINQRSRAKKHITLSSCRHQFAANSKAARLHYRDVSALMGHCCTRTAQQRYGKTRFGWSGANCVAALPNEVQTVRHNMRGFVGNQPQNAPSAPVPSDVVKLPLPDWNP
ncbi:hypothetical protein [Conchiformibius steedae]|uniref:hypothetical protein n=1 Tax=Conchiformibius steedae TaxID=153493 RepID=UPI0026F296E0|nr:hypothetical protein [Conchiformibius steedae]